ALHKGVAGADVEVATRPDSNLARVSSGLLACGDVGGDDVATGKPVVMLDAGFVALGEAVLVEAGHLSAAMPDGLDAEWPEVGVQLDGLAARADAGGIDPVRFRVGLARSVELGSAASADLHD